MALVQIDKRQVNKLHNDMKASLAKNQDVASLLSSAPLTLNLIGQVRLLAFSKVAVRMKLQKPGTDKYEYLKYDNLQGVMQQLLNQATNSFSEAEMSMSEIVELGPTIVGSAGNVTTILQVLGEPKTAQKLLEPTVADLRLNLKSCEEKADAIYQSFDRTKNIVEELNIAIGNEIKTTADSEEAAGQALTSAQISTEIEERIKQTLEKATDDSTRELNEERIRYKKTMDEGVKRRNEFKDVGLRSILGVERGVATAFNAIIGVVRDTPKIALTGAQALGALGGASVQFGQIEENHQPRSNVSQAVDPIFAEAARFKDYLSDLDQLISGDLLHMLQEQDADKDIITCVENIKALQASLKGCKSKGLPNVQDTLGKAIELGGNILSEKSTARLVAGPGNKWPEMVVEWKRRSTALLREGFRFDGAASVQPGMAFGQDFKLNPADTTNSESLDSSDPIYKDLQARRQARLTAMKLSMEASQESLRRNKEKSLEYQNRVTELAGRIKALEEDKMNFSLIQNVLRLSLDCIAELQYEVHNLVKYFRGFSNAIDTVAKKQVESLLRAISAGIDRDPVGYKIAYGSALSRIIVNSILSIRTQFSMALDSARLYVSISEKYITPCLGEMSKLKVGATPEQQKEMKERLATFTAQMSGKITQEITKQFEVLHQQVGARIQEVEQESRGLVLPQLPYEQRQAITEGVREATAQVDERIEAMDNQAALPDENVEMDDI